MADQVMAAGKPRSSVGRKIGIALLVVVLLAVGAVAVLLSQIDRIVKVGVEQGGTYALGTKTTLTSANIGLFSGKVGLTGLSIANAPGYKSPEFFSLGDGAVEVSLSSLTKDVVEVPLIKFSTIRVNLEKKDGKANYNAILENLKKVTGESSGSTPAPSGGGEKKFIVKSIQIKDVKVHVDLLGTGGVADQLAEINIPIDEVNLSNIGTADNGGVDLKTLASVVVNAVLGAAADKGGSLPPEFLADLRGQLAGLQSQLDQVKGLRGASVKVVGKAGEAAKALGETLRTEVQKAVESGDVQAAAKAAEGAAKKVTEAGKDAAEKLRGLIPRNKKADPK